MRKLMSLMLLCMVCIMAHAQARDVSGIVTDDAGETLIGVTVMVEGTNTGTVTDFDGKFTLKADPNSTLLFSYIGYSTEKVKVGSRSDFSVSLSEEALALDEYVVVGYASQRRSDISTAVTSVDMDEMNKSGSSQILESMQGMISGVQISANDGSPAGGMSIKIRGTNSLTGGTQPLFVIDGVPQPISPDPAVQATSNPLSSMNQSDIESIEVLKDAAAAAIYGADGSNGVVLITTKKGEAGKAKFGFSLNSGVNYAPESKLQTLSPKEYAEMQIYRESLGQKIDLPLWQDILDTKKYEDPRYAHNWMDEIIQPSYKYDANASMSGGTESTRYMLSMGYLSNDGLLVNSGFQRFSSRLNLTQKVGSRITISGNFSYSNTNESNPITDWSQKGVFIKALSTNPFLGYASADETVPDNWMTQSPSVYVNERDLDKQNNNISGKLQLEYKIINGLTASTSISMGKNNQKYTSYWGPNTWFGNAEQGRIEFNYNDSYNWVYEARVNYNKKIKKHDIGAVLAYEAKQQKNNFFYSKTTNFEEVTNGIYGVNGGLVPFSPNYTYESNATQSIIARVNYGYDNRYVFSASLRRDGSSRFGHNNKYGLFPALSGGWRVSEESFMEDVDWVSSLKLRASYGVTGNNQFPSYQSLTLLGSGKVVFDDDTIELSKYSNRISNPDLGWESSKQINVGVDFSVFKNRLNITADYYNKTISNMLMEVSLPATSGYDTAWKNAGSMKNEGFELALDGVIFDGPFRWSSNFNISFNKNKVLALDESQTTRYFTRQFSNDVILQVGKPVGLFYGYVSDGIYNTEEEILNSPVDASAQPGGTKFADINRDGVVNADDRTIIANTNPIHTGGWGNTFSYKGFDLYAFFRWSYGNDQINANIFDLSHTMGSGGKNILSNLYYNAWTPEKPENNSRGFVYNDPGNRNMSSLAVEDGSYIRLATLSLGYNLPKKTLNKMGMSKFRISAVANNLAVWTRYSGFDVEANTGYGTVAKVSPGYDSSPYPRPATVALSLELGF